MRTNPRRKSLRELAEFAIFASILASTAMAAQANAAEPAERDQASDDAPEGEEEPAVPSPSANAAPESSGDVPVRGMMDGANSVKADIATSTASHRSDFPRNIIPGYFAWKDRLAARGFNFNVEYLAAGQVTDSDIGPGEAGGGVGKFYGTWQALKRGNLTFKVEHRHAYGNNAANDLGPDSGALTNTGTILGKNGAKLTNLYWTQTGRNERWVLRFGFVDVTDWVDTYQFNSSSTAFQNSAFGTNPSIAAPSPGAGVAAGARVGDHFAIIGTLADADTGPGHQKFDLFKSGEFFESVDIIFTPTGSGWLSTNLSLTLWHSDAASDGTRPMDRGVAFSATLEFGKWSPFLRAGWSKGSAAMYKRSVSAGVGRSMKNGDLAAVGFNMAKARDFPGTQYTVEAFYRISISPYVAITPSVQVFLNPLLDQNQDGFFLAGLRTRFVF